VKAREIKNKIREFIHVLISVNVVKVPVQRCSGLGDCSPPMMMMMDTSRLPVIGASFNRYEVW
jgi:hypothetical protein